MFSSVVYGMSSILYCDVLLTVVLAVTSRCRHSIISNGDVHPVIVIYEQSD